MPEANKRKPPPNPWPMLKEAQAALDDVNGRLRNTAAQLDGARVSAKDHADWAALLARKTILQASLISELTKPFWSRSAHVRAGLNAEIREMDRRLDQHQQRIQLRGVAPQQGGKIAGLATIPAGPGGVPNNGQAQYSDAYNPRKG